MCQRGVSAARPGPGGLGRAGGNEPVLGFGLSGEERGEGRPVGPAAHERERGGSWASEGTRPSGPEMREGEREE